jgi:diaminopimelate decarboxylase
MPDSSPFDWQRQIGAAEAGHVLATALAQGIIGTRSALMFHDLDNLSQRITHLRSIFPPQTLHALAIKSNPVVELLRFAAERGMGLEAASLEEVALARAAGCTPDWIVYDSPAKTRTEIAQALTWGITLNADNFDELERIDEALRAFPHSTSLVGLRINPQVGHGSIGMLSVSGAYSKFGVPLGERRQDIIDAFRQYPWLRALHLHVGSQGISETQLATSVALIFDLREKIHTALGEPRIVVVDIGGGLPWRYREHETIPTPNSYATVLQEIVPQAFGDDVQLVTEYGRTIQVGCGFAASRVEYIKKDGGRRTAVIHFGADLLMRLVYSPEDWYHRISVLAPNGTPKQGDEQSHTIAGPLCFGGDVLARNIELPRVDEGDWIILHDVGGYTLGLWSRHCNRGLPMVLGYKAHPTRFQVLLAGEYPEDVVRFWSLPENRAS